MLCLLEDMQHNSPRAETLARAPQPQYGPNWQQGKLRLSLYVMQPRAQRLALPAHAAGAPAKQRCVLLSAGLTASVVFSKAGIAFLQISCCST